MNWRPDNWPEIKARVLKDAHHNSMFREACIEAGFEAAIESLTATGEYGTWWPLDENGVSDFDNKVIGHKVFIPDEEKQDVCPAGFDYFGGCNNCPIDCDPNSSNYGRYNV